MPIESSHRPLVVAVVGATGLVGDPSFKGIFTYIQEFQGYISPGILAVFVFGMIFKKAPAAAGVTVTNKSDVQDLIILKHFGPGNPDLPLGEL